MSRRRRAKCTYAFPDSEIQLPEATPDDEDSEPYRIFIDKGPNQGLFSDAEYEAIFTDATPISADDTECFGWKDIPEDLSSDEWLYLTPSYTSTVPTKTEINNNWTNDLNVGYDCELQIATNKGFQFIKDVDFKKDKIASETDSDSTIKFEGAKEFLMSGNKRYQVINIENMKVGKNQELLVDFKTPNTKFNWKFNNYPANDLQDIEKLKFKYYYEKGISLEETNKEWELIKRELKLDTAIKTEYFLKILGFFMNDGSLKYDDPDTNNCTSIEFRHVERRYPVYIARCLDKLELKKRYDWSAELLDDGLYKDIQIRSGIWCILFSKWFGHAKCVDKVKFILQLNQRESQWVLDGLFRGDETATYITGSSEEFGNFFTMVALNAGYSTYMTCSSSSPQYRHEDNIISHQEYNSLSDSQKSCFVKTTKTGNSWRLFCGAKDKKNYNSQHPIDGAEITSKLTLCPLWSLKNSTGYTIVRSVKKDGKSKIIKYNKPFIAPVFKTPRI